MYKYTFKSNMVAVVSNGTAVLGLGDIGPEAGLPVICLLYTSPLCTGHGRYAPLEKAVTVSNAIEHKTPETQPRLRGFA